MEEKILTENFNDEFVSLYGFDLAQPLNQYETDRHYEHNGRLIVIVEGKARVPSGNPHFQGADYYRRFYAGQGRDLDCVQEEEILPAFLITYQGIPTLYSLWNGPLTVATGPLVNVYGLACVEQGLVRCEHFITVNAGCHHTNIEELFKLARTFYALGNAFDRLVQLKRLSTDLTPPPPKRLKFELTIWPYLREFTRLDSGAKVPFQYQKQVEGDRLLFLVSSNDPQSPFREMLVKFTRSYGRDVHELLARAKYAPDLVGFSDLGGGWKMIVMEYLRDGWVAGSMLVTNPELAQRNIHIVREEILPLLKKNGFVHGDIKMPNLMFRTALLGEGNGPGVQLIDFDFSGQGGIDMYPWNLNTMDRPPGQLPCGRLSFDHDDGALKVIEDRLCEYVASREWHR